MSEDRALFETVLLVREMGRVERLSSREREVLFHRVVLGQDHGEIGAALGIAARTSESYLTRAGAKLGLTPRETYRELFRDYVRAEACSVAV